jgi:hypothetical protein
VSSCIKTCTNYIHLYILKKVKIYFFFKFNQLRFSNTKNDECFEFQDNFTINTALKTSMKYMDGLKIDGQSIPKANKRFQYIEVNEAPFRN